MPMPRMTTALILIACLWSANWPAYAKADSYGPFLNYRKADATGEYYVVIKSIDPDMPRGFAPPVTFEYAKRGPGATPVSCECDEAPRVVQRVSGFQEV